MRHWRGGLALWHSRYSGDPVLTLEEIWRYVTWIISVTYVQTCRDSMRAVMIVIASLRIQRYTSQLVESSDVLYYAEGRQLYLKMIHLVSSLLENLRDFSAGFTTLLYWTWIFCNFLGFSGVSNILNYQGKYIDWLKMIFISLSIINIQKHYRIRLCGPELEESSKYEKIMFLTI